MTWMQLYQFIRQMTLEQCDGRIVGLEEGRVSCVVMDAKMAGTTLEEAGVDARAGLLIESVPPSVIEFSLTKKCPTCEHPITLTLKSTEEGWDSEETCEGCNSSGTEQA